ncbi:MAG: DUF1499 domain-containing protein [Candidatus Hermodarchaeota archaeon]
MKKRKKRLGIIEGKFRPCPKSPKCVSSQSNEKSHKMEPIKYETSLEEAKSKLTSIVNTFKRVKLISETENYLYFEFRTAFWRFVDDVEFYFDEVEKIIHFRSSARFGYYDWRVNRNRMKKIKQIFENS